MNAKRIDFKNIAGLAVMIFLMNFALPSLAERIQPGDLEYKGAFRLPDGPEWEYSGHGMTYYPEGDVKGASDGYPGSIFISGHDQQQRIAEISIPAAVISQARDFKKLNKAQVLQGFSDIRGQLFGELEIPRLGLAYLPKQGRQGTDKLHFCWGQHLQDREPSHGWCELDLNNPKSVGPWFFGEYSNYVTDDYLFEIPKDWADLNTPGCYLASGRVMDGGWSGRGVALFAYAPWNDGNPPPPRATLKSIIPLILYGIQEEGATEITVSDSMRMKGFKEADEWSGGAWLTAGKKAAVIFVGTKAIGRCWYGYSNGVEWPMSADENTIFPEIPPWPYDDRGWWSEGIKAQIIFFDTDDLAAVAKGKKKHYELQPYAKLEIDKYLFYPNWNIETGKRYLLGAACFDRARGILYVIERHAYESRSLVHVWQVKQ